jgi:hypothetical protein
MKLEVVEMTDEQLKEANLKELAYIEDRIRAEDQEELEGSLRKSQLIRQCQAGGLFKAGGFATVDAWVQKRFGYSKKHVYRLIGAGVANEVLSEHIEQVENKVKQKVKDCKVLRSTLLPQTLGELHAFGTQRWINEPHWTPFVDVYAEAWAQQLNAQKDSRPSARLVQKVAKKMFPQAYTDPRTKKKHAAKAVEKESAVNRFKKWIAAEAFNKQQLRAIMREMQDLIKEM